MKLSALTIPQLRLELALHEKGKSIYNAVMRELESRYQKPPDMSIEPAVVEVLSKINNK